jgi:hypothetical protein
VEGCVVLNCLEPVLGPGGLMHGRRRAMATTLEPTALRDAALAVAAPAAVACCGARACAEGGQHSEYGERVRSGRQRWYVAGDVSRPACSRVPQVRRC